ncbi:MAG: peroxiredoxin family protein [Planctomycetota bacterium]|nr:peroxiredoxin family protein [Planctomycetota bacterium]
MSCVDELRGLGAVREALRKQGGEIIAVSVDAPGVLKQGRKDHGDLPVLLASDESREAITALHIVHETMNKKLAAPATFLIDKNGIVRWVHYAQIVSDRPDPKQVLREVEKLAPDEPEPPVTEAAPAKP